MKNLLIYMHPLKAFYDGWQDEVSMLAKVQIENSLALGWQRRDILLVTNFPYEYNGIKAFEVDDRLRCEFSDTATKINVILYLLEYNLFGEELVWFHDFDAFQLEPITEAEVVEELDGCDMGLSDYGITTMGETRDRRWSTGTLFFKKEARDILEAVQHTVYQYKCNEEVALLEVLKKSRWLSMKNRIKKINITYNMATRKRDIYKTWESARKPLKVVHFHPFDKRPIEDYYDNMDVCVYGKGKVGRPLINDRLRELFDRFGLIKTVIYYTANMEDPKFEGKIIENLKQQAGAMPIISVSRKPIDLGHNICVGEQPVCYSNSFRQLLIGLEEAKTDFCIAAESDVLYPPDYFRFIPPRKDMVYRYDNLFVHFDGRNRFWRKRVVEGAQMCGRMYWISRIKAVLGKAEGWEPVKVNPPFVFPREDGEEYWGGENPVLYFKTRAGIGFKTGYIEGAVTEIPYWGTYSQVEERFLR